MNSNAESNNKEHEKRNIFEDEKDVIDHSFSVDFADAYEKEINFANHDLDETVLEKKLKKLRNVNDEDDKNDSFRLINEFEIININSFEEEKNSMQQKVPQQNIQQQQQNAQQQNAQQQNAQQQSNSKEQKSHYPDYDESKLNIQQNNIQNPNNIQQNVINPMNDMNQVNKNQPYNNQQNKNFPNINQPYMNKPIINAPFRNNEPNMNQYNLNQQYMNQMNPNQRNNMAWNRSNFLEVRGIPKYTEKEYTKMKKNISGNLLTIQNYLINLRLDLTQFDPNKKIGPLMPINYLVENHFMFKPEFRKNMQQKYDRYKTYIFNFRTIYGDGNCYYRAVMFRYLELLILYRRVDILKGITLDISKSFCSNEIKKRLYIGMDYLNPNLILQIMVTIIELVQANRILDAHLALYKSFLFSKIFDYSIILYFRYLLYIYINQNKSKLYSSSFPVSLGNLLPSMYENVNRILFNEFFENNLLKMFTYAEKIIIYITPFVLGMNLNLILFESDDKEIVQKYQYSGMSEINIQDTIYVINRKNHYENVFTLEDNEKFNNIYYCYRNQLKPSFITLDYSLYTMKKNNNQNNQQNNSNQNNQNNINRNMGNIGNQNINNGQSNQNTINSQNSNKNLRNTQINRNQQNLNNSINQNNNQNPLNNNDFQSKTVIVKNSNNNMRNMNLGNQNNNNNYNNYSYQNQNNNNVNNFGNNNNYYNNNNNNCNYSQQQNQNNYQMQNNQPNEINAQQQMQNNNYQQNLNQNYNNKNMNNETSNTSIYFFQEKNNLMKYNSFFDNSQNIYSLAQIYKNFNMNNQLNNNNINYQPNYNQNNMNNNLNNNSNMNNRMNNIKPKENNVNNNMNNNTNYNSNQNINMNSKNNMNNISNNNMINSAKNINNNNNNLKNNISLNNNLNNSKTINYNMNNISNNSVNKTFDMNEIKKEISGFGPYKCSKCSLSHTGLKNIKNICQKCFIIEIISQSKKIYLEYLKNVASSNMVKITKDDFNNLFLNKIAIRYDNKNYSIYQVIEELNIQDNKDFNANNILNDIILEIKQGICLFCYADVHNLEFQLPCGCNFCSFNHLESFVNEKIGNKLNINYKCFCSFEYKPNKIFELCNFLKNKKVYKNYNYLIQQLNAIFGGICFKCGEKKNDMTSIDIEGFCPINFNHFMCEDCIENESSNYVKCSICSIQHKYLLNDF